MQFRTLGRTGLSISRLSFGAGPVSTLMVGEDSQRPIDVVRHAIDVGINWIDTAATYGNGASETNLGHVLSTLGCASEVHVATKVRLTLEDLNDIRGSVRRSFDQSLQRLRLPKVTLLQLHNSLTRQRGDEPTSITADDVLKKGGVADAFDELRHDGLISYCGLTGIGNPQAMDQVVRSGRFDTMQVPYHLLNPSAGSLVPPSFGETDYGNIIASCAAMQMGVLAIRVLAGGALAGNEPSPHTLKTPFFPLALYERDRKRATAIAERMRSRIPLPQLAIQFALAHPAISSAIIGFGDALQIDEAVKALGSGGPFFSGNGGDFDL